MCGLLKEGHIAICCCLSVSSERLSATAAICEQLNVFVVAVFVSLQ